MGFINLAEKTISAKLVYYGVGMGGKTTSLQAIHEVLCPRDEVQLVSISTEDDSTLLFDFLPIDLGQVEGFKIRIQGFTVPGQPKYKRMRKFVLQGADAVVLVVDSQRSRLEENRQSLQSMHDNLRANGIDPDRIPVLLQYNKRDLDDVMPEAELDAEFRWREDVPSFPSIAHEGFGVFECFVEAAAMLVDAKVRLYGLGRGTVSPEDVAEGARRRLWEIHAHLRGEPTPRRGQRIEIVGSDAQNAKQPTAELTDEELQAALAEPEDRGEDEDAGAGPGEDAAGRGGDDGDARPAARESAPLWGVDPDESWGDPGTDWEDLCRHAQEAATRSRDDDDDDPNSLLDEVIHTNVELARMFGDLDRYKALLERKNRELVQVAQNTVHDLNRPLSVIRLTLSSMRSGMFGQLEGRMRDAVENGLLAASQMERLIRDLIDSSRLDYDGVQLRFEEVDMDLLVAEVLATLRFEIDEKDVVCVVEPLPRIVGDAWALEKAFTNLVGNALQYVHRDRRPRLAVRSWREADRWVFQVEDNGIGIPEKDRDRLFRRFERGSNTGGVSGTGLGLHIIREAVMGHGGEVWVESREGQGTKFMLAIPFAPEMPPHSVVAGIEEAE